jgi:subtilisin family serine protease
MLGIGLPAAKATADPLWNRQYGPTMIGADNAWQKSTGKGVTVAVVDSGVDVDHPDLKAKLVKGRDFACSDDNPDDDSTIKDSNGVAVKGHGTHVAGTVGAITNNNTGVAGVAPDVKIMPLKVFASNDACQSSGGGVFSTAITAAIDYAVDNGAKVINLSLDQRIAGLGGVLIDSIASRCTAAFDRGSLCVVAAGNDGSSQPSGYARSFTGMVVTANDKDGKHAAFGQRADTMWGVSAPGVAILNTWPMDDSAHDGYNEIQGTSMAAPHVSGAAALLFATGLSARAVAEKLVNTAGPPRDQVVEGAGLIHVDQALGLEPVTTTLKNQAPSASGGGSPTKARSQAGGGSRAVVTTAAPPTTAPGPAVERGDFEAGLSGDEAQEDFNQLRLNQASKNSANKPFNAAGPLLGLSAVALLTTLAVAIPRMRSKDAPPLT